MSDDKVLSLYEVKKADDLDRLDPREFARLVAAPASQLDLMRLQLEVSEALNELVENINKQVREVQRR